MMIGMYPTEWELPEQDKEELRKLLGMSAAEWEKRGREERERLAEAEQAGPRRTLSPDREPGRARRRALPVRRLVAALR